MKKLLIKYISLTLALLMIVVLSGCGANSSDITWYDFSAEINAFADKKVAQNSRFELWWTKEYATVKLVDKTTGVIWSNIPDGAIDKTTQPNVFSPILLSYIEGETLNSSNTNAYTASVKKGMFSTEIIENGIQVTYYFKDIAVSIPVKYTLSKDSLKVSINPAEIGEDENLVYNIGIMPFLCSVDNAAEQKENYLFVPSGSGALIYPQTIGTGITSIISEEMYGYDEQITNYSATKKQSLRLPVYGAKNGENAVCAIIESADSSAVINTNVGSSSFAYSSVYTSFNIRGSEISSSKYMGGMSNKKVLFCDDKITEEMTVGFYPLYGEDANYSGIAKVYRKYLLDFKNLDKKQQDNMLSLKFIGGVQTKEFFLGVPYNSLYITTNFEDVSSITNDVNKLYNGNISVNLIGFGKQGYDIGSIAGGYKYNSKYGNIKQLESIKKNSNISVFFNFDIVRFIGSSGDASRSAIGGKNQKEYVNLWSMEKAGSDNVYYLLDRAKSVSTVNKLLKKSDNWAIDGISLDTYTSLTYSDYSDNTYVVKSGYDKDMEQIYNELSKRNRKFAATGTNQYAALYADQIFDTPTESSKYQVYGDDIPFYQIVFKGYVPMSVSSLNLSADKDERFLKAVESGVGISYTLIKNFDTDILTSKQNAFYASLYTDNKEQIEKDISRYKECFSKISNCSIKGHYILSENLRCTVYENGYSVFVNFGDKEEKHGDITVSAKDFIIVKEALK